MAINKPDSEDSRAERGDQALNSLSTLNSQLSIEKIIKAKLGKKAGMIPAFIVRSLARLVREDEINEILRLYGHLDGVDFMEALAGYFRININITGEENLPPDDGRRYIFVSNHPLGGLDGICLSYILGKRYGGRIRCLVNDLLLSIPNLRTIFVPVNKHGAQSRDAVRQIADAFLSDNHILTFPAGLCSRRKHGAVVDGTWHKSFVQKAIEYSRDVVPLFFDGQNSALFYRFANFREQTGLKFNLEMLLLPSEMFKQKDRTFGVYVGKPVSQQTLAAADNHALCAARMKEEVYKLAYK